MTVGAALGFFGAHRVRDEGAESLPAEAFRRNSLLLIVDPIAVVVLGTHQHGAGRAHRGDSMAGDRAINRQAVDIVAQNLEIVRSPIASCKSLVVQHGHLLICAHWKPPEFPCSLSWSTGLGFASARSSNLGAPSV